MNFRFMRPFHAAAVGILLGSSLTSAWAQAPAPRFVRGQYLVVLNDGVADPGRAAADLANRHGLGVGHVYSNALKGFSATIPDARLKMVGNDPRVKYVEQDQEFEVQGKLEAAAGPAQDGAVLAVQTVPTGIRRIGADLSLAAAIDRVDQRVNVNVAVLDTGIQSNHPDLNVVGGRNFTTRSTSRWADGHGPGTHVAGTIAAIDNGYGVVGVAPGARLYAAKVLTDQGSGQTSWIIAGIDWVTSTRTNADPSDDIAVANMSVGGGSSSAMLVALDNAVAKGVVFAVAAGNSRADCRGTSPANSTSDGVITTSALADSDGASGGLGSSTGNGSDDWIATFSNNGRNEAANDFFGNGVDAIAPGVNIYSTYKGGGYTTMSGTSMASPHAAGVAALFVSYFKKANNGNLPYPVDTKAAVLTSSRSYAMTGDGIIFGMGTWRAINGDYDSGYSNYMDAAGYEPLINAEAF